MGKVRPGLLAWATVRAVGRAVGPEQAVRHGQEPRRGAWVLEKRPVSRTCLRSRLGGRTGGEAPSETGLGGTGRVRSGHLRLRM